MSWSVLSDDKLRSEISTEEKLFQISFEAIGEAGNRSEISFGQDSFISNLDGDLDVNFSEL